MNRVLQKEENIDHFGPEWPIRDRKLSRNNKNSPNLNSHIRRRPPHEKDHCAMVERQEV